MVKVGIVEDMPDEGRLYKLALASRGYPIVFVATDGIDAIRKFRRIPADIVIMNYLMPVMDGLAATKAILELNPSVKVIFTSGDETVEQEALESGAVLFLKKPLSLRDLIKHVDEVSKSIKSK